jgi:MYXO-CTERM domain-containing protein
MLTTFGTFWGAEGAGVDWPGGDAALPVVLAFVALMSLGYVTALRRRRLAVA